MTIKQYELNGYLYTVEKYTDKKYVMTVYDKDEEESYSVTDPSLIIKVLMFGKS